MIFRLYQFLKWNLKPKLVSKLVKFLLTSPNIKIGKNVHFDGIPEIHITENGRLTIGDNSQIRKGVEIRVHKNASIEIGSSTRIDRGVRLLATNEARLKIGNGARVGLYSVFNSGDSITLGESCLVSGFVYLQTSMHRFSSGSEIVNQGFSHAPVVLEKDVWLGTHVVVMPGCTIGQGSVVGSNAVVTKSLGPGIVAAGVPANEIKKRA